ncbi:HpcH/HpaI aldolase/citrate lyase family protein [Pseudonocardia sp. ICBG1293]|uniref:HpcH/HpaI aldolase family protein n=1 Tax=Pseudonocardia sp. ICBG1293 TaxID=2844382 RepID=UPI001CCC9080|nr:aldolase/citrate lyase family protein [Pseudonocardia sp. ICBG1293]
MTPDPLFTGDAVGGWLQLPSPAVAEIAGSVGFDLVCVDTQHGLIGDDTVLGMLQALSATGTPSLVRVPGHGAEAVGRALDRGADGVIVPLVDTAEQAAAAVAACRYPPDGVRSFGPVRPSWRGGDVFAAPRTVVMVETVAAVANLAAIVAVDGLSAVFVGPSDLALAHGFALRAQDEDGPDADRYAELVAGITAQCARAGVPVGIYCDSPAHARRFRALGCTFTMLAAEQAILRSALAERLAGARP